MAKTKFNMHADGNISVGAEYSEKEKAIIERNKTKEKIYKWISELFFYCLGALTFYGLIYSITKTIRMAWYG